MVGFANTSSPAPPVPVRVIAPAPMPVSVGTTVPVRIEQKEPIKTEAGADVLIYVLTFLTLLAGSIAAFYAIKSYRGIGKQINLANEQLRAANDQLSLAREELDAVKRDLEYSQEQSAYIRAQLKRPDAVMILEDVGTVTFGGNAGHRVIMVSVTNLGLRTLSKAHGYVLIPVRISTAETRVRHTRNAIEYFQHDVNIPSEVWPEQFIKDLARFTVRPVPGEWKILWKVFDDFGGYPEERLTYTEATFTF